MNNGKHIQPSLPDNYKLTDDIDKQLKEIASRLRPCCEEYDTVTKVSGMSLISKGILEVSQNGLIIPIVPESEYAIPGVALKNIKHHTKLRRFYRVSGILGVHDYLSAFPNYEATMIGQYPSLWESGTYIGVIEGTQLPVDQAWLEHMRQIDMIEQKIKMQ